MTPQTQVLQEIPMSAPRSAIVTVTMNPAVDISAATGRVTPLHKLRCHAMRRDPGGGGINVARVVSRLGGEVTAIYPIGGFVGERLKRMVDAEGVKSVTIPLRDETREDFSVDDEAADEQYRFVLPGPSLAESEWLACLAALTALEPKPAFVCASGSLPLGVPDDFYARLADTVAGWGAKLVIDASGAALKAAVAAGVYLIKPNLVELGELAGAEPTNEATMIAAIRSLIASGCCEVVALTLGADGALLATADRVWRAAPLRVEVKSTVGTGDSFLGGLIWALAANLPLEEAFRYAVAAGSAAVLSPGTELCLSEDVRRLLSQVVIEDIAASASVD
jgi:6-phosphofructokinase 2